MSSDNEKVYVGEESDGSPVVTDLNTLSQDITSLYAKVGHISKSLSILIENRKTVERMRITCAVSQQETHLFKVHLNRLKRETDVMNGDVVAGNTKIKTARNQYKTHIEAVEREVEKEIQRKRAKDEDFVEPKENPFVDMKSYIDVGNTSLKLVNAFEQMSIPLNQYEKLIAQKLDMLNKEADYLDAKIKMVKKQKDKYVTELAETEELYARVFDQLKATETS